MVSSSYLLSPSTVVTTNHPFWQPSRGFAVPKKKVSLRRRHIRNRASSKAIQPDKDIIVCPKCRAVKKKFVLMHCPGHTTLDGEPDGCGFLHDTYVINGGLKPKGVTSAAKQGQTYEYVRWNENPKFASNKKSAEQTIAEN